MLRQALSIALLALAAPAAAQDAAAEFAAAASAFALPAGPSDWEAAAAALSDELSGIQGDWVAAHILFPDPGGFDPALVEEACARRPLRIEKTSPHGFAAHFLRDGGTLALTVRHDWLGFRSFQRSADEAELRAYLGLPEDMLNPAMFTSPAWRGPVEMFHPSPGILVLQPTGAATEIWARCP